MQNKISYDDYIRSILGYPPVNSVNNIYQDTNQNIDYEMISDLEIEKCYPEIYKIVYPMVMTKCNNLRGNISNEDIENMTDEIYYALEEKEENRDSSNSKNDVRTASVQSNAITKTANKTVDAKVVEKSIEKRENRETRQFNRGLRDLIKILLIRELLNRPGGPHRPRPPMPGPGPRPPVRPPMRPPFGPGPGGPGRPPFNREFETSNYDIFEY